MSCSPAELTSSLDLSNKGKLKKINDPFLGLQHRRVGVGSSYIVEQKGNQLVECLSLYQEFVKHGKKPEETKNQFCIPAEWVKTLDPRIKEKIRTETRADMEAKGRIEKAKKAEELDRKIKAKKITEADKQMELKIFDQMLENCIQNEIAKRIDKAHNYSFNFANYKSTISNN